MNPLLYGKCALLRRLVSMRQPVWEATMDVAMPLPLQPLVPKQMFLADLVLCRVKDWVML
ncbi:MAG: hypothetical protein KatS3mg023_4092 [Armatimonadota bacterium]|nr:MAG: hypothetical protein KatS3mg023_4092 [Armatimonadota bacterium]